ncbi:sugar ABC transporter substrate-binding protein [Saccharospirillum salsuginis]|uniref:Sugar ABC transporter substrate-binding protein n=1 Tax=Saccharospirillum salsuginis TaxID=418750 RepID=A0A918K5M4_9GAMM|nr:sugar ABC transporter substrate-binding protein [Saccharospirillum salsuginis]
MTKLVVVLLTVLTLAGCAGRTQPGAPPELDSTADPYRIGVGDTVAIHVWRNPELTQSIVVRPDGYISMPLMGDLKADGRKPEELAEVINRALSQVIRSPEVTVMVTNPASAEYLNRVRVTGQVPNPLSIPFKQGMTVLDLVLQAGGVTDFGAGDRATIQRLVEGEYQEFKIDLDGILNDGNMTTNYTLQPGDLISVPKKRLLRGEL